MNYGGWYNNPATGKNQRWFNGVWTDGPEPGASGGGNSFQSNLDTLNKNTNAYADQQSGFAQTGHDITANQLGTQNTLALGSQDQGAKDSFLNSVFNPLQKSQGTYEYKYGLDTNHENATYGLNTTANTQNRKLALDKLANDEQWALKGLDLNQANTNQSTIEGLNGRGMLYGQTPTGGLQPTAMGGMNGIAGVNAGQVNTDFANQRGSLTSGYGLNVLGTNQGYDQNQNMLNENHGYTNNVNAYDTSNNINNQNMNFLSQTQQNDNQLKQAQAAINNQKQTTLYGNEQNAKTQGAMQNGFALYK